MDSEQPEELYTGHDDPAHPQIYVEWGKMNLTEASCHPSAPLTHVAREPMTSLHDSFSSGSSFPSTFIPQTFGLETPFAARGHASQVAPSHLGPGPSSGNNRYNGSQRPDSWSSPSKEKKSQALNLCDVFAHKHVNLVTGDRFSQLLEAKLGLDQANLPVRPDSNTFFPSNQPISSPSDPAPFSRSHSAWQYQPGHLDQHISAQPLPDAAAIEAALHDLSQVHIPPDFVAPLPPEWRGLSTVPAPMAAFRNAGGGSAAWQTYAPTGSATRIETGPAPHLSQARLPLTYSSILPPSGSSLLPHAVTPMPAYQQHRVTPETARSLRSPLVPSAVSSFPITHSSPQALFPADWRLSSARGDPTVRHESLPPVLKIRVHQTLNPSHRTRLSALSGPTRTTPQPVQETIPVASTPIDSSQAMPSRRHAASAILAPSKSSSLSETHTSADRPYLTYCQDAEASSSQHRAQRSQLELIGGVPVAKRRKMSSSHEVQRDLAGQAPSPVSDGEKGRTVVPSVPEKAHSGKTMGGGSSEAERKVIIACHNCRSKKLKCDGARPRCHHCTRKREDECCYETVLRRRGRGRHNKNRDGTRRGPSTSLDGEGHDQGGSGATDSGREQEVKQGSGDSGRGSQDSRYGRDHRGKSAIREGHPPDGLHPVSGDFRMTDHDRFRSWVSVASGSGERVGTGVGIGATPMRGAGSRFEVSTARD